MDRDTQKREAIERMQILNIMPEVVKDFSESDKVYVSERQNNLFNATLFWASNYDGLEEKIREFEMSNNAVVFHVQFTRTQFGNLFSFLYVSEYDDEWETDKECIRNEEHIAYVYNENAPDCSEVGFIGIKPSMGGVKRIW